ncbi:uncharacterized protein VTP21DRAFT_10580 [Calcarisporiella thermophila]|uniref:uncharacterized protein n=1 Tax=Calcarisporiella thermophila TaxID=911321 RepID=UPI0037427621
MQTAVIAWSFRPRAHSLPTPQATPPSLSPPPRRDSLATPPHSIFKSESRSPLVQNYRAEEQERADIDDEANQSTPSLALPSVPPPSIVSEAKHAPPAKDAERKVNEKAVLGLLSESRRVHLIHFPSLLVCLAATGFLIATNAQTLKPSATNGPEDSRVFWVDTSWQLASTSLFFVTVVSHPQRASQLWRVIRRMVEQRKSTRGKGAVANTKTAEPSWLRRDSGWVGTNTSLPISQSISQSPSSPSVPSRASHLTTAGHERRHRSRPCRHSRHRNSHHHRCHRHHHRHHAHRRASSHALRRHPHRASSNHVHRCSLSERPASAAAQNVSLSSQPPLTHRPEHMNLTHDPSLSLLPGLLLHAIAINVASLTQYPISLLMWTHPPSSVKEFSAWGGLYACGIVASAASLFAVGVSAWHRRWIKSLRKAIQTRSSHLERVVVER